MNAATDQSDPGLDDRLGALVASAAPPGAGLPHDRAAELSLMVARQVVGADRGTRSRLRATRRRQRAAAIAATVAVVFVPTGAWAAQHFLAQTGEFGSAQAGGLQDSSEFINMCARDFAKYVATLAPTDLPAPPDHDWAEYVRRVATAEVKGAGCGTTPEGAEQATSLRLSIVSMATSDWGCSLVRANRASDTRREQVARKAMNQRNVEATRLAPDQRGRLSARHVPREQPSIRLHRVPEVTPAERRLEAIAIAHGRVVLSYLVRRTTPAEEAADVYQEVLTTAWRKIHAVPDDQDHALAWLLAVARRPGQPPPVERPSARAPRIGWPPSWPGRRLPEVSRPQRSMRSGRGSRRWGTTTGRS